MGAYDVRVWLVPQGRTVHFEPTDDFTSSGEPVQVMSFPRGEAAAPMPELRQIKDWLASRGFAFNDKAGCWEGMTIDVYDDEGNELDSARVTMPAYNWQTRRVTSLAQLDIWIKLVHELARHFSLRIVGQRGEMPSSELRDTALAEIGGMGFRNPPG